MSLFYPIWYFLWHRYLSLWFGISGAFQTIEPLQQFFSLNLLLSSLIHAVLSILYIFLLHLCFLQPLLSTLELFTHLLWFYTPITSLLLYIIFLLFLSKSSGLLSCLLSCPLLRGRGVFSVRAQSINSFLPSFLCLLSDFLFPTSLFRSSYASVSLSLSLFDRDLNSPELDSVTHM